MSKVRYKYCVVPDCKSTTTKTPDKLFFSIPTGDLREKWCEVMGRNPPQYKPLSAKCNRFCCEDHFNLEKDMENYMQWRLMGSKKLILKKGVVPHKFDCRNVQTTTENQIKDSSHQEKPTKEDLEESREVLEKLRKTIKKKKKASKKIAKKGKPHQNIDTSINSEKKVSRISKEEEKILQQRKKIQKISQIKQDEKESEQQTSEMNGYTFQIKVEAIDENELNETILEEFVVQNSSTPDQNSQELDVAVKVEELDEEFEPIIIDGGSSQLIRTEHLEDKSDDFETLLIVYDSDHSADFVIEQCN